MIFWPIVAALVLAAVLSYPLVLRPQLDHRHHARTLANIARLERELGYDVTVDTEYRGRYAFPVTRSTPWSELGSSPLDRYEPSERQRKQPRDRSHCVVCGKRANPPIVGATYCAKCRATGFTLGGHGKNA